MGISFHKGQILCQILSHSMRYDMYVTVNIIKLTLFILDTCKQVFWLTLYSIGYILIMTLFSILDNIEKKSRKN